MTLTFESDNDVIVYALERIISYARKYQYIFVAQSVWWIASVISLTEGLVTHIDNLQVREITELLGTLATDQPDKEEVTIPQDIPDCLSISVESGYDHPDRKGQVDNTTNGNGSARNSDSDSGRASRVIKETKEFLRKSQKERKKLRGKPDPFARTRSGQIPVLALSRKQKNCLRAIPKDTIAAYLRQRK